MLSMNSDAVERTVEAVAVGRRQHRVARDGDHRLDLPVAGGVDLLGERGGGQFGQRFGIARDAAVPAPGHEALARSRRSRRGRDGREREHRPAGPVEISGQDVDDVDQPAAERAEFDCGGTDSAVHRRRWARQRSRGPGCGSRRRARRSARRRPPARTRRPVRGRRSTPVTCSATPPRSGATRPSSNSAWTTANSRAASVPGRGAMWRSASSAVRVRAGSMTVSLPPRLRKAAQLAGEVRSGGQTTVGHKGIRADDHQVVGAVEVGHGERDRAAEHVAQRDVFGHLVQRARGEHVAGAERADDQRRVQAARDGVRVRVAEVHADRRPAVVAQRRAPSRSATTAKASSQVASVSSPSRRTSGRVSRSGSLSSSAKLAPFGQMNPALKTSSRSPRAPVTRPSSMVSVRPQVASHSGQIRSAVLGHVPSSCADVSACSYTLGSSVPM